MLASEVSIQPETLSAGMVEQVEGALLDALRRNRPSSPLEPLHVTARAGDALVGAMVGGVSYGWLHVELLWVAEEHRNRGTGARIMHAAEDAARARGCHGAWLDTSSEPAYRFYVALGYEVVGLLENRGDEQPAGHRRWFMQKRI